MSSASRLIYLPLGGAGEIGMNAYVYGYGKPGKERLILVDLGVTFPDMDGSPGVNLIFPDLGWLKENRDRLEAVFITHAHEDHVGAIGHYYAALGVPVYARAFTAHIARLKMAEQGQPEQAVSTVAPWPETVEAGPFRVGFVPISHSIPESSALVIETERGRVVHSGDFKLDPTPIVGEPFDPALWQEIAAPGVHALVCDSTNVFSQEPGRSELGLGPAITELVAGARGRVVATTFASNVARVKTLAEAGVAAGRSICLMGRAMRRMIEASVTTGVLSDFPSTISPEEAASLPRDQVMLLVTGSQGERRAASAQLAQGRYHGNELEPGDLFLFSSKTIPGNERGVIRIINQFSEKGVDVVDDSHGRYHVSGHANRPDLLRMHEILNPDIVIPMHGEHRHLRAHAELARQNGRESLVAVNGMMVDLTGPAPQVAEFVEAGRVYLDGIVQIGALDGIVRARLRLALNGHVMVSAVFDESDEPVGDPWCVVSGLPEEGVSAAPLVELLEADLGQLLNRAEARTLASDDALEEALRKAAIRIVQNEVGKRPQVGVSICRLLG